jgi:catalase
MGKWSPDSKTNVATMGKDDFFSNELSVVMPADDTLTIRLVAADGTATFVKFHWTPVAGVHSLVWDEAQKISGKDPDFNRRDLWDAIAAGDFPEWDLGVQLVAEADEHEFDFDLLDATKIIPEEEVPLRVVGRMVLDRNPDNFFAETEQVAFHTANVVPGIDFTNDPLLQARNFSYLDTQLIRLGGPNFAQLPVNRPVAEVHHHQRDGYGQQRIDDSSVSYHPNSLGAGCPALASVDEGAFRHYAERVDGRKIRERSPSFKDHYSQATLFLNSMSDWEREHLIEAFRFELGKCEQMPVRERVVTNLNEIDHGLAVAVAEGVGVTPPPAETRPNHGRRSPALSQAGQPGGVATRKVAVLAADGVDAGSLEPVVRALREQGVICEVLAPQDRELEAAGGGSLAADRGLMTMSSVLYDAVLVAGGDASADTLAGHGEAVHYVAEAYKHAKTVGAIGAGVRVLERAPLGAPRLAREAGDGVVGEHGLVTVAAGGEGDGGPFAGAFAEALGRHRHFDRDVASVPA